jgi:hypothetical protein
VIAKCFELRSDVNVKNHWATMTSRSERIIKYTKEKQICSADCEKREEERFAEWMEEWGW